MTIVTHVKRLLTESPYSRSQKKINRIKGVIMHWTGVPGQRAETVINYFDKEIPKMKSLYASSHYVIDIDGTVYLIIPENEVAYHCGTSRLDPYSIKVYTDWAREKFGAYAWNYETSSPNWCTLGIEMCVNEKGKFTTETLRSAEELVASLLLRYNLTPEDVGRHFDVVGWKDCPRPWVESPAEFLAFKNAVKQKMTI